jgi:hypothetical protein
MGFMDSRGDDFELPITQLSDPYCVPRLEI